MSCDLVRTIDFSLILDPCAPHSLITTLLRLKTRGKFNVELILDFQKTVQILVWGRKILSG